MKALTDQKVYIGRIWSIWPTKVHVTVGAIAEMKKFKAAFTHAMA